MPNIQGWLRITPALQRVWIRSTLQPFSCHFVPVLNKTARCPAPGCPLCELLPAHRHGIIVVQSGELRELKILELRERHADLRADLSALERESIGRPLFAWVDTAEHGKPICLTLDKPAFAGKTIGTQRLEMNPVPCERYIDAIGRREYRQALELLDTIRAHVAASPARDPIAR